MKQTLLRAALAGVIPVRVATVEQRTHAAERKLPGLRTRHPELAMLLHQRRQRPAVVDERPHSPGFAVALP